MLNFPKLTFNFIRFFVSQNRKYHERESAKHRRRRRRRREHVKVFIFLSTRVCVCVCGCVCGYPNLLSCRTYRAAYRVPKAIPEPFSPDDFPLPSIARASLQPFFLHPSMSLSCVPPTSQSR